MAKIFLDSGDTFLVSNNNAQIYGASLSGTEVVRIADGATSIQVDQNVERVEFGAATASLSFKQAGIELMVYSGNTLIATIPLQADGNGTLITTTNGTMEAKVSASGMTLGGAVVSATTAGAVAPVTVDTTIKAPPGGSGVVTPPQPSPTFMLTSSAASVDEGRSVTFTVAAKNVSAGEYSYLLGGTVTGADITGGMTSGTVKIDALGVGYVPVSIAADSLTEGSETLTLSIGGVTSSAVTVNDTSLTSTLPAVTSLTNGPDVLTGGAGNDTFNALVGTTGMTFGSNDILDGGAGTADILFIQNNSTGVAGPATLSNIEIIQANFSAAGTISLLGATGITTIENSGSSQAGAFSNIGSLTPTLKVSNTGQDTNFGYTASAVVGTTDSVNLGLSGVSGGTITIAGVETVNITSSSAPNTITGLTAAAATSVKVAGDQSLGLGTLGNTVTTLDASANTATGAGVTAIMGAVASATITGGSGNDDITIDAVTGNVSLAGGAGNDTVRVAANLTTTDSIDGGAGTADVLRTTAAIAEAYVAPATRTITGFEQLTLTSAGTAGTTLTTANVDTGITRVNMAGTAGAYGVTGPAGALTVTTTAALGGALTLTDTGTATTDSVTLTNSGVANANVLAGQNVTSTGYETLTINVGSGAVTNLAAQTLGVVTVTPDTGGTGALVLTGGNAVSMGATNAASINASALTGTTGLNQSAAPTATTVTITGSGKADTLVGGLGNDNISGGAGDDNITGGVGADVMTGGDGADTFVFAANATGALVSNAATQDTITDFVSGTDKLNITNITSGAVTKFLGNYANFTLANSAATADLTAGLAFFVTGENNLYVQAVAGTQGANDTVIKLNGVTSLAAADFLLGAQGTGNTIATTAPAAVINATTNTNATFPTTALDDTITSTYANMVGTNINGGAGNDSLTISSAVTTALNLSGANVLVSVENLTLAAGTTAGQAVTLPATASMRVTNSSSTAAANVTMAAAAGQTFTTSSSGVQTIILGNAQQSVTTGSGGDSITATAAQLVGSTVAGGLGSDTLTVTGIGAGGLTLSSVATSANGALVTGVETVAATITAASTITLVPDAAMTINMTGAFAPTIDGTGSTITVGGVATQNIILSGTSNFVVSGQTTGNVTSTSTGTLSVTSVDSHTVTSATATAVDASGLATGNTLTVAGAGAFTVTGVGTTAGDIITESATATGALTVTTVDTNASAVTQVSGASGAFILNATGGAGTDVTTLTAFASHASQTINMTSTSAVTVATASTATAYTINATDANAHVYIADTNTAAVDTYTGGSAVDTVTLSLGADRFTTGGGADVYNIAPTTDTGIVAGFASAAAVPAQGQNINVTGCDVITVTGAAAAFTIVSGLTVTASTPLVRNGGTMTTTTSGTGGGALITGTYSSTGLFTVDTGGTSSLFVYDDNGTTDGGNFRGIVLVGYVDQGGVDTYTGTFTAVV